MTGSFNRGETQDTAQLTTDVLFDVFSDVTRRIVLFHLRQQRAATTDELVDVIAEVGEYNFGEVDNDRILSLLVHTHLPKLEAEGLVTYDPTDGVVTSSALHQEIGEWLDLAVRRDLQLEPTADDQDPADEQETIRVLLADDEPGLPETIAGYIERENPDVSVTTATSALEAVTTLESEPFDCIVSDYQMPAISGLDFLNAVREKDTAIPFIVFTAKGSEEVASQAIATGVTDYVQKGPDTDQYDKLVERVRNAVGRAQPN